MMKGNNNNEAAGKNLSALLAIREALEFAAQADEQDHGGEGSKVLTDDSNGDTHVVLHYYGESAKRAAEVLLGLLKAEEKGSLKAEEKGSSAVYKNKQ